MLTAKKLWNTLGSSALKRWLFTKVICFNAPFFAAISPRITVLQENLCEGYFVQRRSVQNHIGTVHAIALCNLAELCAGLMTDVSVPAGMRWIPKGMQVHYLKKAKGKITARAVPLGEFYSADEAYNINVRVSLFDEQSIEVFYADIEMWVSKNVSRKG